MMHLYEEQYSLVLNKRPPPLLIFGNFPHPNGPYLDPPAY